MALAGVGPGDLVLDVGAGHGAITDALLAAGAKVVAVELHPERAAFLRRRYHHDDVVVVQADAIDLRLPRRPFTVVANPPFGAVSPLLRRLLRPGVALESAVIVAQSQVVRRWAAPDAPGAQSLGRTPSDRTRTGDPPSGLPPTAEGQQQDPHHPTALTIRRH